MIRLNLFCTGNNMGKNEKMLVTSVFCHFSPETFSLQFHTIVSMKHLDCFVQRLRVNPDSELTCGRLPTFCYCEEVKFTDLT